MALEALFGEAGMTDIDRGQSLGTTQQSSAARAISRREVLQSGLLAGVAFALASCGSNGGSNSSPSAAGGKPATKPERLVVRAWGDPWSTNIEKYAGTVFTDETGIPVKYDLSDAGEAQTKVKQALDAGDRPPVDVVYTIQTLAYTASVQKLLRPLDPTVVTNFANLTKPGLPVEGTDYVNLYSYAMPVMYNPAETSFDEGTSWAALADAKYKGGLYAGIGFQAMLYPYSKMLGLDMATDDLTPVWDLIATLRPNISVVGDDTVFIESMKSGDAVIGSALVGDGLAVIDGGTDVKWVVPPEGAGLLADSMYVCAGIPDDVAYYGQVYINKVIDANIQSQWCAKVATVPTNKNAKPASFMQGDPAFPFTDEELAKYAIIEPVALVAENFDAWNTAYTAAIQA
jgi:putative spermidine/putrescine transport system substrate-binding protein